MTDDRELANLLGKTPRTPDPGFRIEVLARMAAQHRRRAAFVRAWKQVVAFSLIGAFFPIAQALGLTWQAAQPLVLVAAVLAFAYFFAALTIEGPGPLLARSRILLRVL